MCAGTSTSASPRFSVNSCDHSGRSRNRSSEDRLLPPFLFLFWFVSESRQFPDAGSSLRSDAGLEDALDESCGGDVEDELKAELDCTPRTTRGKKFSVLHRIFLLPLLGQPWFLTADPLIGISVFLRRVFQAMELQAYLRVIAVTKRSRS